MPETKAHSHSQGLGFCGKVQAGQGLDGRGMRRLGTARADAKETHCQGGGRLAKEGVDPREKDAGTVAPWRPVIAKCGV